MDRLFSAVRTAAERLYAQDLPPLRSQILHIIRIRKMAATQHTTTADAVIQASFLSPERTASNQKKALAREQEIAPRNQKNTLTSHP